MFWQAYGNYGTTSTEVFSGAMGAFFGSLLIFGIIIYVVFLIAFIGLSVLGLWKVFDKAGEEGWKALIPFYNSYTLIKVAWKNDWFFWALLGVSATSIFVSFLDVVPFFWLFGFIVSMGLSGLLSAMSALVSIKLGKAFGCSDAFIIGLVLLPVIFLLILGFDKKHQYQGARSAEL